MAHYWVRFFVCELLSVSAEPHQGAAYALNLLQEAVTLCQTAENATQLLSVVCDFQQRQVIHQVMCKLLTLPLQPSLTCFYNLGTLIHFVLLHTKLYTVRIVSS